MARSRSLKLPAPTLTKLCAAGKSAIPYIKEPAQRQASSSMQIRSVVGGGEVVED